MQKHANLVDLAKSFPTNIFLQNLASIQKRTSPLSLLIWLKNKRKVRHRTSQLRRFSGRADGGREAAEPRESSKKTKEEGLEGLDQYRFDW